jgi:hypothetical protein
MPAPRGAGDPAGTIAPQRGGRLMVSRSLKAAALVFAAVLALGGPAGAKTLRVSLHSDLKIVDPVWTTALITVNHGYMIYDTLFALDEKARRQAADGRPLRHLGRQADLDVHAARRARVA